MKETFLKNLNIILVGQSCTSLKHGLGTVVAIDGFSTAQTGITDIMVKIDFNGNSASYYLYTALENGVISFDKNVLDNINGLKPEFDAVLKAIKERRLQLEKERMQAERERRLAEEAELEKQKREQKIRLMQSNAAALKNHPIALTNDFYTALGFLAKHVKTISANVPDFLESWFTKTFPGQTYTLCDASKKTSGGFSMKWGLSLTASLKDINDDTELPEKISRLVKNNKINDTQFVYDLVYQFGFSFGKKQELDNILKYIPADKVEKFYAGYTL